MGDALAQPLDHARLRKTRQDPGAVVGLDHMVRRLHLRALPIEVLQNTALLESLPHLIAEDPVCGEAAVPTTSPARYDRHTAQSPADEPVDRVAVVALVHDDVGDGHPLQVLDMGGYELCVVLPDGGIAGGYDRMGVDVHCIRPLREGSGPRPDAEVHAALGEVRRAQEVAEPRTVHSWDAILPAEMLEGADRRFEVLLVHGLCEPDRSGVMGDEYEGRSLTNC